jgi:ribulose-phosphate 3-epimerase
VPRVALAPSILTADFSQLGKDIASVADIVDWFHLDVMDGHYVANLTFGPAVVGAVRRSCDNPLHVHAMISDPARYAGAFACAGAERISFHPEAVTDPGAVIDEIERRGARPGVAVHPDVPVEVIAPWLGRLAVVIVMTVRPGFGGQAFMAEAVPNIGRVRELAAAADAAVDVEVDGGVKVDNLELVVEAGADIVVAGSAIFDGRDPRAAALGMRARLDELTDAHILKGKGWTSSGQGENPDRR